MNLNYLLFFCVTFSIASFGWSQSGPCGVGNSSNNIIWLDAHAMNLSDGTDITIATDFSGNGNNFTQGTSSKRPIYNTGVLNGLPVFTFDGSNDRLEGGSISGLETSEVTYFFVYTRANFQKQMLIDSKYSSDSKKYRTYCNNNNNKLISCHYSPTIKHVNFVAGSSPSFMSSHITASNIKTYNQGNLAMTTNATYTAPTGHLEMHIGNLIVPNGSTQNYPLNGFIAEMVLFNSSLNNLERIFVENYLGAKYGLAVPTDLYAYEASHNIELVGIGDDGTNSQTTAQGKDVMEFSSPASMSSGEYLLAAHTDVPLSDFTTSDVPAALTGYQRWTRTWKADETGDVGTVTISFELAGLNDFANSSTYTLLVDTDGDFSDATTVSGTYNSGSVDFQVDLNDGDLFTLCGLEQILEIHSITNGPWGTPSTWDCTCIPGANDDVYIDPLTSVSVEDDAIAGYLNISLNGTLNMNQNFNLTIMQDFDISGTLNANDGSITMAGDSPQTIDAGGSTIGFNDLIIQNTGPSSITFMESQYELNGLLSPNSGGLILENSSTNFIVKSSSSTTGGRIGPLGTGFSYSGDITVQRFIPSGSADWRNLSSPVSDATFDIWDSDLAMSGPGFPDGCAAGPNGCFHSVRYWERDLSYNVSNSSDLIEVGKGYEVYCGDDLVSFSGTTLNTKGTVQSSADIVLSLNEVGWWTVGNPYACPIKFSNLDRSSQVGNYFYIYDSQTGGYQWYDGSSGTSSIPEIGADGLLGISQGFWVHLSSSGTLTMAQVDKTVDDDVLFIRSENIDNGLYISLKENASTYETTISFEMHEMASDGYDEENIQDIMHLTTGFERCPNMAIFSDDSLVRKNWINADLDDKSFDLLTEFHNEGYYTITPENMGSFSSYNKILLYDGYTGSMIDLREENYTFHSAVDSSQRFTVIFSNEIDVDETPVETASITDSEEGFEIVQMGTLINIDADQDAENVRIVLYNTLGQEVHVFNTTNLNAGSNVLNVPAGTNGVRILCINHNDRLITKKLVF